MESFIGATRHYSEPVRPLVFEEEHKPLTPSQLRLLKKIPFYPHEITLMELSQISGISSKMLYNRLSAFGYLGLVAEDDGLVTRLKEDLSNVC